MPYESTFIHNHVAYRAAVWPIGEAASGEGRIEISGGTGLIGAARFTTAGFIEVPPRLAAMRAFLDQLLADEQRRHR